MTIMPFSNCMWNAKLVAFCDENTLKTCTGTGQKKQYDMAPEVKRILTPIIPETFHCISFLNFLSVYTML